MTNTNYTISVSKFNSIIRDIFNAEELLHNIKIVGEVFGISLSKSATYFSIKDEESFLPCVSFYGEIASQIKEGDSVIVTGSPNYYAKSGRFNFVVNKVEPFGQGLLYQRFLELKDKLQKEGLFDEKYKKNIPSYPSKIAVLSAYPSAALMDVMRTLKKRFPVCRVIIFPIPVQGKDAYLKIISTLKFVDELHFNTIILARGGGSLEDLWNFNEEALARTIFELKTPIICGIGHEIDFTICDYVCDLRALTPTYAAIEATPNIEDMYKHLSMLDGLLKSNMKYKIETLNTRLNRLTHFYLFKNPEKLYGDHLQYVSYLQDKISNFMEKRLNNNMVIYTKLNLQLQSQNKVFVSHYQQKIQTYENLLKINFHNKLRANQNNLSMLISKLNALSPLQTLERGYALVKKENQYVSSIDDLNNEDNVSIYLKDGYVKATIHKE